MADNNNSDDKQQQKDNVPQKHTEEFPLQEYRLVPVEEWDMQDEEHEIDLLELGSKLWDARKTILKITGIFVVIGLLVALLSTEEYTVQATLMPELQSQQSQAGNLLQKYGGMLGINAGSMQGSEGMIPPTLYPKVVASSSFLMEMMQAPVPFAEQDTTVTPFVYFQDIQGMSLGGMVTGYTLGLPGKIIGLFKSEDSLATGSRLKIDDEIVRVNEDQQDVLDNLSERITASVDEESGVINLTAQMPDAVAAAAVGQKAIKRLKYYVSEYRTEKAKRNLEFVQTQYNEAQARFRKAQEALAEFRDQNRNLATAQAQTQLERLQDRKDLAMNVFNSMAQQLEQAKLQVQEQKPVFKVLQPVSVPLEPSEPNRKLIVIVSLLLGGMVGCGYVLVKEWWQSVES